MDSGPIDSHRHLGINAPPKHRIQVRKVTTCAPIPVEGTYSTEWTSEKKDGIDTYLPTSPPGDAHKYYFLGNSWLLGFPVSNYTYVVSNMSIGFSTQPYNLEIRTAYPQNFTYSGFAPIPELARTDADVTVLFLNNRVAYTGKVMDPWFQATLPIGGNRLKEAWVSNSTLTGIGCTEQYQFCNSDRCTPLRGIYDPSFTTTPQGLDLNPIQQATHRMLGEIVHTMRMNPYLVLLKNEILLASTLVYGSLGISTPLPDTQWQTEMESMHNISMAGLQRFLVGRAAMSNAQIRPGVEFHSFVIPATDPLDLHLCANQKFRSSTYSSFNMFGLCFLILTCAIIIITNLSLPSFVHRVQRRSRDALVPRLAWIEDNVLQLQRIALEARGIGPWKKKWDGVPVTAGFGKKFRRDTAFAEWEQLGEGFKPLTEPETGGERGELKELKSRTRVGQESQETGEIVIH